MNKCFLTTWNKNEKQVEAQKLRELYKVEVLNKYLNERWNFYEQHWNQILACWVSGFSLFLVSLCFDFCNKNI